MSRPGVPGVTRCVTNSKDCSAAAYGKRILVRRGAGDGVRVCRGSGLRGVLGDSTVGSIGGCVGALIETNLNEACLIQGRRDQNQHCDSLSKM